MVSGTKVSALKTLLEYPVICGRYWACKHAVRLNARRRVVEAVKFL